MLKTMTLYQKLLAAGCKMGNHESDLYVEATDTARDIIAAAQKEGNPVKPGAFVNQVEGGLWLDLPFCFDPWWEARAAR